MYTLSVWLTVSGITNNMGKQLMKAFTQGLWEACENYNE